MRTKILQVLALVFTAGSVIGFAQAPKDGVYISDEDVKAVLKRAVETKRTNPDNAIRVIDMGDYQLGVAVIHRGAMGGSQSASANTGPRRGGAEPLGGMRRTARRMRRAPPASSTTIRPRVTSSYRAARP